MRFSFFKMQGCGNDYLFIDARRCAVERPEVLAPLLSDRHTGIGADGLVCLYPSQNAAARMRMFNADGSEGMLCGNAARCVGRYLWDSAEGDTRLTRTYSLETPAGILSLRAESRGGTPSVSVCLGRAHFPGEKECGSFFSDSAFRGAESVCLPLSELTFRIFGISVGNPHGVIFPDENPSLFSFLFPAFSASDSGKDASDFPDDFAAATSLPPLPTAPRFSGALAEAFPQGVNLEYVLPLGKNRFAVRVWERGSGETRACGSGACAVAACAVRTGRASPKNPVTLLFPGGELTVEDKDGALWLSGAAEYVFRGEVEVELSPRPHLAARWPLC